MAVFRIEHNTDYTVIGNCVLRDKTISEKALGLFVRILSLPANWDFSINGLVNICKGGYDSVENSLNELEENGYLVRNRVRDDKGRYDTEFVFYENPIRVEPSVVIHSVKTPVDNPGQYNKDILNKDIVSKDINTDISKDISEEPVSSPEKETKVIVKDKKEKPSKEEVYKEKLKSEYCQDVAAILYWITTIPMSQEYKDALTKWYHTQKGNRWYLWQIKDKLKQLKTLYPEEKDRIESILQSARKSWKDFYPLKKDEQSNTGKGTPSWIHLTPEKTAEDIENDKKIKAFFEEEKRKEEDNVTFTDFV